MTVLLLGLFVFFGVHLIPFTSLKPAWRERLGVQSYKLLFTIPSLLGFVLIVWGFVLTRSDPDIPFLYTPPAGMRHLTILLVLLGFLSLAASFHKGRLKLWLRNPMSIGVALWAVGHLISNGRLSHVLLFGCFLAYALLDIAYNTAKGNRPRYEPKPRHDLVTVVAGVVLFLIFGYGFHPYVLHLPVIY